MHMIGAMYAPNERLTLMGMFNLVDLSMNHRNLANGMQFKTESSELGDSSVAALYRFWENRSTDLAARAHLGLGLLLPTAETDREDLIPGRGITRLPYPMQLGTLPLPHLPVSGGRLGLGRTGECPHSAFRQ